MRIGLLITGVSNFGQKGFYNAQEIGLAKALDVFFSEVIVYRAVPKYSVETESVVDGCKNTILRQIPVGAQGINGKWDCSIMDKTLDALIYFSDTQLAVASVYKWCANNNIKMYPYIGVVESHSTSKVKKLIVNGLFVRNISVYKKCTCFVKTSSVQKKLDNKGVKETVVAPVGLDLTLLNHNYEEVSIKSLKNKYSYLENEKVILFIGRMTKEKQPLHMIDIFKRIYEQNSSYKLLMVGKGELLEVVKHAAEGYPIRFLEQIVNKDIWELYRLADAFVNLNQQEIFGMSILEAMYYGCKVVAWRAPGPDMIIHNGIDGWLVDSDEEVIKKIYDSRCVGEGARKSIIYNHTWTQTAKLISDILENKNENINNTIFF